MGSRKVSVAARKRPARGGARGAKRAGGRPLRIVVVPYLVDLVRAMVATPADAALWAAALAALFAWGAFKGIYDANIFATAYDVVRPGARGAAAGVMNMVGWALGAAPAAWITGAYADRSGGQLGPAIAMSALAYVVAGVLLLLGVLFFVKRDRARMLTRIAAETAA